MDRDGWLALLAGVLGILCIALLLLGPIVYVQRHGAGKLFGSKVDGKSDWQSRSEERLTERTEREKIADDLGLTSRYRIIRDRQDLYDALYFQRDYARIEQELAALWAKEGTYDRHRYSAQVEFLGGLSPRLDPESLPEILDAWVESYPNSHRARLVRGYFYIRYAWYFRGDGRARTVSQDSFEGFRRCLVQAREDFEAAYGLAPEDPASSVGLIAVAMGLGQDRETQYRYYRQAIHANPLDLRARDALMYARTPKWGGSWEDVEAVRVEANMASAQFPLLGVLNMQADKYLAEPGGPKAGTISEDDAPPEWAEPYLKQLALNPDRIELRVDAAYWLYKSDRFAEAEAQFDAIGDVYYANSANFEDLLHYNDSRGNTSAAAARELPAGPYRRQRIAEAHAIAPNHFYTNYLQGTQLMDDGRLDEAIPYFQRSREARPDFVWHTYRLAEVAERQGKPEEAVHLARQVFDMQPSEEQRGFAQDIIDRNR